MKNIHLLIFVFLVPFAVTAQNQSIDSLKNVLKILPQDSVRVNVLNSISTEFIKIGRFDSANRYVKPAIDLQEKFHYQTGAVIAFHNLAVYNFHIKEYKTGKFFLLKSLNAALLINDKKNIATNYKELSDLYQLQSNFKQARESNNKYILYRDSLAKEENAKHAAENNTVSNIKQGVDLKANNADKVIVAVDDNRNQQILYIALFALLILSILIVLLIIKRGKTTLKRNAILLEENIATEEDEKLNESIQLKNSDIKKEAFLQKIIESESLYANNNVENKQSSSIGKIPIVLAEEKKIVDEKPILKPDFEENNVFDENEKPFKNLANKITAINVITGVNSLEPNSEFRQELTGKSKSIAENEVNESEKVEKEDTSIVVNKQYSNLIFVNQLSFFNAKFLGDNIKLIWKTDNEENIVRFEVEKSSDDIQYVSIETITAKSLGNNSYEIFDFKPLPGLNFYRLEIIDTKGDFIYSPTVQVEVLPVSKLNLICYPTHVKDVIMVTAAGGKLPILVNIFNKAGQKKFTIETPPNTTPIYLTSLAAGIYTLQMKCEGKTILQQLIKM